MGGAVGSSMVGHFFGRLKDEPKISIRKYCDIYLICKQNIKDKKLKKLTQNVFLNIHRNSLFELRFMYRGIHQNESC